MGGCGGGVSGVGGRGRETSRVERDKKTVSEGFGINDGREGS